MYCACAEDRNEAQVEDTEEVQEAVLPQMPCIPGPGLYLPHPNTAWKSDCHLSCMLSQNALSGGEAEYQINMIDQPFSL